MLTTESSSHSKTLRERSNRIVSVSGHVRAVVVPTYGVIHSEFASVTRRVMLQVKAFGRQGYLYKLLYRPVKCGFPQDESILSNVKRQIGGPTSCFIWLQEVSLF